MTPPPSIRELLAREEQREYGRYLTWDGTDWVPVDLRFQVGPDFDYMQPSVFPFYPDPGDVT